MTKHRFLAALTLAAGALAGPAAARAGESCAALAGCAAGPAPEGRPAEAGFQSRVVAVAAGDGHSCALTAGGRVFCWGDNTYGQLGDGTMTGSLTPVAVKGLGRGVGAIALGRFHSCAVTAAGAVRCWGNNWDGQLGDGTTTRRPLPVQVRGLRRGAAAVVAGFSHSCALTTAGAVWCWGLNSSGQLGDGSLAGQLTPVRVRRLPGEAVAVAAGALHSCAVTAAGTSHCWGYNFSGQLGDGSTTNRPVPVAVRGLRGRAAAVAAGGSHGCAASTTGAVRCWGANSEGQLGDGSTSGRPTAAPVRPLPGMTAAVAAGEMHSCARSAADVVHCWGNNWEGQIGDGSTENRLRPVEVSGLPGGVAAIALGARHSCAATSAGQLWCWGKNISGQLGDGTRIARPTPVRVQGVGP